MSLGRLSFPTDPLGFGRFEPGRHAPRQISSSHEPNRSGGRLIVVGGTSTTIVEALGTALSGQPGLEVLCTVVCEADMFESISRQRPDGVVLYVPKLDADGIKMIERLKQQDPTVRVVMLTGQSSVEALAQAAEAGAAACCRSTPMSATSLKPSERTRPTPCSWIPRRCLSPLRLNRSKRAAWSLRL